MRSKKSKLFTAALATAICLSACVPFASASRYGDFGHHRSFGGFKNPCHIPIPPIPCVTDSYCPGGGGDGGSTDDGGSDKPKDPPSNVSERHRREDNGTGANSELQMWMPVSLEKSVTKHLYAGLWVEPRIGGNLTDFDTLIVRPSVGLKLNDHAKVATGFDWVSYYRPEFMNEYRIWQQIELDGGYKKLGWYSRNRLEERFLPHTSAVALRLRTLNKLTYPISKSGKWYLVGSNEIFTNLNDAGPIQAGFDQDRIFAGVGRKLNPHIKLETGYQLQLINNDWRFGGQDRINHIIMVQLMANYLD